MKNIAWIGTGVMGAPMATHIAKAGYSVKAYNRTFSKAQALEPEVQAVQTIKEAVEDAEAVFMIVGFPKDVENVFNEVMKYAKRGTYIVDMTTSSPKLAKSLYQKAKEKTLIAVDAPVTGGDLGAINATLSIMVGGDEEAYKVLLPFFEIMGSTVTYMGQSGNGQHAKLANQISIAGALVGAAESLTYANNQGLDLEAMLKVITGGSASSWQAANNGPKMIQKDYAPGFFIKHFLKDLRLAQESFDAPVLNKVIEIYEKLVDEGYENDGTQAVYDFYND